MMEQNFVVRLLLCLWCIPLTFLVAFISGAQNGPSLDLDSKYYSQNPSPWLPRPPLSTVTVTPSSSTRKGREELKKKNNGLPTSSPHQLPEVIMSRRSIIHDLEEDDEYDEVQRRDNSKGRRPQRQNKGRRGRRPQKKKPRRGGGGNRKPKNGGSKNPQKNTLPLPASSHQDFVESQWNQIAKLNRAEREREREMGRGRGRGKDEKRPGGLGSGQHVEKLARNLKSICSFLLPSLDYKGSICAGERPVAGRSLEGGIHFGLKG